jgi:hypothetical protein
MQDDAALLRRYADDRSEEAFTELVNRHLGLVYHAALRQCGGDRHRAEEVSAPPDSIARRIWKRCKPAFLYDQIEAPQ